MAEAPAKQKKMREKPTHAPHHTIFAQLVMRNIYFPHIHSQFPHVPPKIDHILSVVQRISFEERKRSRVEL